MGQIGGLGRSARRARLAALSLADDDGGMHEPASVARAASLCREWFADTIVDIAPLASSGFSGGRVFLISGPVVEACVLKSFHAAASRQQAAWVHRLAGHLRAEGIVQVPEVIAARDGDTIVADADGALWEMCRFMPGVAVTRPDSRQSAAVGETLARLHLAAARLPGAEPRRAPSPGIQRRVDQARRLLAEPWEARRAAWPDAPAHRTVADADVLAAVGTRFTAAIRLFAAADGQRAIDRLARMDVPSVPIQPVLRDVWSDHVLLAGPAAADVTGIIDLHAAGIDTPATDIARLLGSWEASGDSVNLSPAERHPAALEAYERTRPLDAGDRRLIGFLHATAVICGLDNWFRWTLEERRRFPAAQRVLDRIDRLMRELQPALAVTAAAVSDRAGNVD